MRLLLTLALLFPLAAVAQPADSTSQESEDDVSLGFRPRFGAFYSTDKGFGVGGRFVIRNLALPGSRVYLDARIQQRFGSVGAMVFSRDPYTAPFFVGVGGSYADDRVRRFFGIGPQSFRGNRVHTHMESASAEVRLGWSPLDNHRLLIQPVARLLHWNVQSFYDARDAAFISLDERSQRNVCETVGRPATGITYGLELLYGTLDAPRYPSRGYQIELMGRRYDGIGDNAFQYWSNTTVLYGFLPTTGRQVVFARAILSMTHGGDEPLPFYALPHAGNRLFGSYTRFRMTGNDLFALSVGYRIPIATIYNWYALDATVLVSAANAYDDIFDQFALGVSFDDELRDEGERTPLRPAISLGLDLVNIDRGRILIGGQIGADPEGFRIGTLRLVYSIRDPYPLLR